MSSAGTLRIFAKRTPNRPDDLTVMKALEAQYLAGPKHWLNQKAREFMEMMTDEEKLEQKVGLIREGDWVEAVFWDDFGDQTDPLKAHTVSGYALNPAGIGNLWLGNDLLLSHDGAAGVGLKGIIGHSPVNHPAIGEPLRSSGKLPDALSVIAASGTIYQYSKAEAMWHGVLPDQGHKPFVDSLPTREIIARKYPVVYIP